MSQNNINKKDNNNEKDVGICEIDITNLPNQTVTQLNYIASTLGIAINSNTDVNDIIEQIKIVYKRKQDILDKQEYDKNLNSFNKEIIEFKIKDGIDPLEWSFWKVFRNKFLYRKIMSNMDTHFTTPYNSIISIENMIKFNQLNILRDKVIRNQYLSFGYDYDGLLNNERNKFNQIFRVIKNNDDQDRLFYQQLFKHYGQYSLGFNNVMVERIVTNGIGPDFINTREIVLTDIKNGREQLVNDIITSDCIPALQVLIQHYQYIPTIGNLHHALSSDKYKFVKLSTDSQFNLQSYMSDKIYNIRILSHLFDKKLICGQEVDRRLNGIIQNLDFEIFQLKSLIIMSKLILNCNSQNDGSGNNTKATIVPNGEIESFSNSLSKQELKSTLSDKSNQTESRKEMIKKLLQLCYSFSNIKYSKSYYIYFSGDDDQTYTDYNIGALQSPTESYKSFLRFGKTNLVSFRFDTFKSREISKILENESEIIFSHCQNKKKQMKFINQIIDSTQKKLISVDPIFYKLILFNDDLDQIKLVTKGLGINRSEIDTKYGYTISKYIKSKLVLEWIFENSLISNDSIWWFKSVELLQHYELLYQQKAKRNKSYNLIFLNIHTLCVNGPISCNIEIAKHIFKNGSIIYNRIRTDNLIVFVISHLKFSDNDKFELLKLAYSNFKGNMDQIIEFLQSEDNRYGEYDGLMVRFMDWIFRNFNEEFNKLDSSKQNYFEKFIFLNPYSSNDEKKVTSFKNYIKSSKNDLIFKNTLNLNIQHLLNDTQHPKYKEWVYEILSDACFNGKLNTIQYFHHNYSWLLVKKSESNPNGIFTTEQLNEFLIYSLENNQLVISDYLFDLLFSITKRQFNDRAGNISRLYYRNKS